MLVLVFRGHLPHHHLFLVGVKHAVQPLDTEEGCARPRRAHDPEQHWLAKDRALNPLQASIYQSAVGFWPEAQLIL